jgi:hypothetical protein
MTRYDQLRQILKSCLKGHAPVARDGLYFADLEAEMLVEALLIQLEMNGYEVRKATPARV